MDTVCFIDLATAEAPMVSHESDDRTDPTRATILTSFHPLAGLESQIDDLRAVGELFFQRGWSVGTSSNYSIVLDRDPLDIVITASGKDKGRLKRFDFVRIDASGNAATPNQPKSSAESLLHVAIAERPGVGAVLHTHSVWGTLLSDLYFEEGGFTITGYEMLKGLAGVDTHEHSARVEIFDNTQDIPALAEQVRSRLHDKQRPLQHGFLIRRHGLYTWGQDIAAARRHIEIFEFLFECVARRLMLTGGLSATANVH